MGVSNLTGTDLSKTLQGVMGMLSGQDPASIDLTGMDDAAQQTTLQNMLKNVFDRNDGFVAEEITDDASPADSPHSRLFTLLKKAVRDKGLQDSIQIAHFNTALSIYGEGENSNITFDSEITDKEIAAAEKIIANNDDGLSRTQIYANADTARTNAAEAARLEAAEVAEAAEQEAARIEQEAAAEQAAILAEQNSSLTENFSFSGLGFEGTRAENIIDFTQSYQGALKENSDTLFGAQTSIFEIEERMRGDVEFSNKALAYVIQSGNFKDKILANLEKEKFLEAKVLLRQSGIEIDLTNSFDSAARTAVQGYLNSEIGLGTSNLRQVESNAFTAFLEENGYKEITDSNTREFLAPMVAEHGQDYVDTNREALLHDTSAAAIKQNIANGSIPFVEDLLPEDQKYIANIVNDDTRNMAFAAHLSNTENFIAYSAALKDQPATDLTAKLANIKDVALIPETAEEFQAVEDNRIEAAHERAAENGINQDNVAINTGDLPANPTPTQLVASQRLISQPSYPDNPMAWSEDGQGAGDFYRQLPNDQDQLLALRQDQEVPQDLKRLSSIKQHIISETQALEDGSAKGNPAELKGNIQNLIGRFEKSYDRLTPEQREHIEGYLKAKGIDTPQNTASPASQTVEKNAVGRNTDSGEENSFERVDPAVQKIVNDANNGVHVSDVNRYDKISEQVESIKEQALSGATKVVAGEKCGWLKKMFGACTTVAEIPENSGKKPEPNHGQPSTAYTNIWAPLLNQ